VGHNPQRHEGWKPTKFHPGGKKHTGVREKEKAVGKGKEKPAGCLEDGGGMWLAFKSGVVDRKKTVSRRAKRGFKKPVRFKTRCRKTSRGGGDRPHKKKGLYGKEVNTDRGNH